MGILFLEQQPMYKIIALFFIVALGGCADLREARETLSSEEYRISNWYVCNGVPVGILLEKEDSNLSAWSAYCKKEITLTP